MTIAVIIGGKVDNLIECESVELAASLLPGATCVDAAKPDGGTLNIGDDYPEGAQ